MLKQLINFYKVSSPRPCNGEALSSSGSQHLHSDARRLKYLKWSTFLSATFGYGMYYVCRLSLNVVKKPIVDEGIFSETELGIIGSVLFFTYALGKFTNGFLADRSNINRFMTTGLLVTALVNLCLGFTHSFILFALLWGISGWFQSMGAASCVVGLSRWFTDKERGSYYGFWSASHNIGEALTFLIVASIVSVLGWRYGFFGAGIVGLLGALIVWKFFHDTPESQGFPPVNAQKQKEEMSVVETTDFNKAQRQVLMMPAIWILALSSAFMYISRYAINSWGVFYLEAQKGYSTLDASFIISICPVCGIVGTIFSGVISDKLFGGRRNVPALIFGLMNVLALSLFLLVPGVHFWIDVLAMVLFGLGIGVLICFLGGLMAVDIAPRNASGAALGVVGIASYIGAGLQDVMSGVLIEGQKTVQNGVDVYDFTYINWFWIGAALLSVLYEYPETYPWIYSNYIQIYTLYDLWKQKDRLGTLDFYYHFYGDFNFYEYTANPWIDFNKLPYRMVKDRWGTFLEFVKERISKKQYVYMILNRSIYRRDETWWFHPVLIWGYDDNKRELYCADNNRKGKFDTEVISYANFELATDVPAEEINGGDHIGRMGGVCFFNILSDMKYHEVGNNHLLQEKKIKKDLDRRVTYGSK